MKIGRRRVASSVLLLQITHLKAYGTSIPCRRRKNAKVLVLKPSKRRKLSNFDKDRADVLLAASDQGSYFEQEMLIALDEEEQSRWEYETVSASRSKIEDKGKDEPAEPGSQESWQKWAGRGNRLQENLVKSVSCRFYHAEICDFIGQCFCKIRLWFILDRVLSKRRALPVEEYERCLNSIRSK